jgi:hypothetical protein
MQVIRASTFYLFFSFSLSTLPTARIPPTLWRITTNMTLRTVNISDHLDPAKCFPRSALHFIPPSLLGHPVDEAAEQAIQGIFEHIVGSNIYLRQEERWDMEGLRVLIATDLKSPPPPKRSWWQSGRAVQGKCSRPMVVEDMTVRWPLKWFRQHFPSASCPRIIAPGDPTIIISQKA